MGGLQRSCKSETVLNRKRTWKAHAHRGPGRPAGHAGGLTPGPAGPCHSGHVDKRGPRREAFALMHDVAPSLRGVRGGASRGERWVRALLGLGLSSLWGPGVCDASGQRPHASTNTEASPSSPVARPLPPAPSLPRPYLGNLTGGREDPLVEPKLLPTRQRVTTHRVTLLIFRGAARAGSRARPAPLCHRENRPGHPLPSPGSA